MKKVFLLLSLCLFTFSVWADLDRQLCPPEKPLQDKNGWCYTCDNPYAFDVSPIECAKCKNRVINAFGKCAVRICPVDQPIQDNSGFCYGCYRDFPIEASFEECSKCPNREMKHNMCALKACPKEKPLQSIYGYCYPCIGEDLTNVKITPDECQKCSNRSFENGRCVLKEIQE